MQSRVDGLVKALLQSHHGSNCSVADPIARIGRWSASSGLMSVRPDVVCRRTWSERRGLAIV